jgi:hypothetical protein
MSAVPPPPIPGAPEASPAPAASSEVQHVAAPASIDAKFVEATRFACWAGAACLLGG